ncbi:MAG: OmpA family protein, partial [Rhizobiales bacterium]|nr:OmpA family protein [Hyphomicrobiales bacterium]
AVPSFTGVALQVFDSSEQITASQGDSASPQSFVVPPAQTPLPSQDSSIVQNTPSSQSASLRRRRDAALADVAKLVNLYDERDILIVGHTDAVGDAAYNQRLSERRAVLVKQYFIDNFEISPERLQIEGKGEQDPINSNATADGRNANRRVEVVILD